MSESLPLAGRAILVTRQRERGTLLCRRLQDLGAAVHHVPTIEVKPLPSAEVLPALSRLKDYDWLLLTSVNAVAVLRRRSAEAGIPPARWPPVCAIGRATSDSLVALGVSAVLVPSDSRAEGVIESLRRREGAALSTLRLILPRARRARLTLPEGLRRLGASVDIVPLYENRRPDQNRDRIQALITHGIDLVTLTSSSTARHLLELAEPVSTTGLKCAVIGPTTAETARRLGLNVVAIAPRATTRMLVSSIVDYFEDRR